MQLRLPSFPLSRLRGRFEQALTLRLPEEGQGRGIDRVRIQDLPPRADTGFLVNIEPQTVAGAVKEALEASLLFPRLKPSPGEQRGDGFVNLASVRTGANGRLCFQLGFEHCVVLSLQPSRGRALDDSAGDVAEVTAGRGSRKNIDDDGESFTKWSVSLLVGVATLFAACHDRVLGGVLELKQGAMDQKTHTL